MRLFHSILFVVLALLGACTGEAPEAPFETTLEDLGPGEVTTVNGRRIPDSIFRLYTLNSLQADVDDLTDEGREAIIDRLIYLSLLTQEAERVGLEREPDIAAEIELARMEALSHHMTERFAAENPPSESELRDLYQRNIERFLNTRFKTRHILVDSEAEARNLIAQLDSGSDFAELARQHSTDSSTAPDGGDLGWISAGSVVQPFAQAMEAAEPGNYTATPVQTQYGWHVILVEARDERAAPGLDAVREDLMVNAREEKLQRFVESLRDRATIALTIQPIDD